MKPYNYTAGLVTQGVTRSVFFFQLQAVNNTKVLIKKALGFAVIIVKCSKVFLSSDVRWVSRLPSRVLRAVVDATGGIVWHNVCIVVKALGPTASRVSPLVVNCVIVWGGREKSAQPPCKTERGAAERFHDPSEVKITQNENRVIVFSADGQSCEFFLSAEHFWGGEGTCFKTLKNNPKKKVSVERRRWWLRFQCLGKRIS